MVIDLKVREFKPEDAGKMNFYLSAVDNLMKHSDDKPSIGIILCKGKNKIVAEYSLRDTKKPVGVTSFQLVKNLPVKLQEKLPSTKELRSKLKDK